jgi:hypothetical protein
MDDRWLCTFILYQQLEIPSARSGQLLSGQPVQYGKGKQYGLSIIYNIAMSIEKYKGFVVLEEEKGKTKKKK